mgnify:CR=1 FL=1
MPQSQTTGLQPLKENLALGGKVRLIQPEKGYRAGLDAALLAAALDLKPGERALEAGAGAGAALVQAAARRPDARFVGVERDDKALALLARNIALNALSDRAEALSGDVGAGFRALGVERVDLAFSNPPFFDDPGALRAPSPGKRAAWMAEDGLKAWCDFLLAATRDRGRIVVIHRADRLGDLLALLGTKAGSFQIRPVQPFADQPAKRVIVRAVRGGKAPLVLLPALTLHPAEGAAKHTPEADAILRGESALDWL